MSSESPKRVLFGQFAAVAKAAAHPYRLELLEQLAQGERSVEVLADRLKLSMANASQHLQHMRRGGLVAARRDGKFVFYRLADDAVLDLVAALRRVAETQSAEVERVVRSYFANRDALEPVARAELMSRLRDGVVTVLDVRPADEFALGHLPSAINVPLAELERRLVGARSGPGDRGLLPRSLLRLVLRGSGEAARARLQGSAARGWLSGMARCRIAGRSRRPELTT